MSSLTHWYSAQDEANADEMQPPILRKFGYILPWFFSHSCRADACADKWKWCWRWHWFWCYKEWCCQNADDDLDSNKIFNVKILIFTSNFYFQVILSLTDIFQVIIFIISRWYFCVNFFVIISRWAQTLHSLFFPLKAIV